MSHKHDHAINIDCYSIVIATAVIPNADTGNASLIEVLDGMVVPPTALGAVIPVVVFCRLKGHGKQIPTRFLWVGMDGKSYPIGNQTETLPTSPAQAGNIDVDGFAAMRVSTPHLPPVHGEFKLMVEFWEARGDGGKWVRGSAYAFFNVQAPPASPTKPS